MRMSLGETKGNRLSACEVKAVRHQNDSLPDDDTAPDEAQQSQGIVELAGTASRMIYFLWSL